LRNEFDEGRADSSQFPPDGLGNKGAPSLQLKEFSVARHHIVEKATTIYMSTNALGDFAKCTIISRIISEDNMLQFSKTAADIWQAFIHQPQTARCLLFLLLVGYTCESLAQEYAEILEVLKDDLGLSVSLVPFRLLWPKLTVRRWVS